MRQPPENSFVARTCISGEKPSPNRIRRAFASAADAPMALSSSPTTRNRSVASAWAAPASVSSFFVNETSSAINAVRSTSAFRTASTAVVSSAWTSCSTYKHCTRGGTRKSPDAIIFRSVVFPRPFGPTMPYRRPCAINKDEFSKSVLPAAEIVKESILTSSALSQAASFSSIADCEQANCAPSSEACSFAA